MYTLKAIFEDNTANPKYTKEELIEEIKHCLEKELYLNVISFELSEDAKQ